MVKTKFEENLQSAFDALRVQEADILYLYSDLRSFGRHALEFDSKSDFCRAIVEPLLAKGKTILLPTFTYTTSGDFVVESTKTRLGAINNWILEQPEAKRSEHPLFSYAALGPEAAIVENIGKSAFGADSVYDRLYGRNCAFLHIGRPVFMGNTALHYVEQRCGATYRVHKGFQTRVIKGGKYFDSNYTAFLRRRDVSGETFNFVFSEAAASLYEAGLVREVGKPEDFSNISFYAYEPTIECLIKLFYKNQQIFIESHYMQY